MYSDFDFAFFPQVKALIYNHWVYTGLDYSKSDGWALGALGYEICGMENPFYRRGVDSATYDEKSLPRFPNFVSPEFEFVILGLLKKDPKEVRLGNNDKLKHWLCANVLFDISWLLVSIEL